MMNDKERKDINRLTRILVSYSHKRNIDREVVDSIYNTAWSEVEKINHDILWKNRYDSLITSGKITVVCSKDNETLNEIPENARRIGQIFVCPEHNVPYTIINNENGEKITIDDRDFTSKIDKIDQSGSNKFWKMLQNSIEA